MIAESIIPTGQKPLKSNLAAVNHLTEDVRDKPLGKTRVRMKVTNRCTDALTIMDAVVPPGTHEISVYEHEVKAVLAMVETDRAAIEKARDTFVKSIVNEARDAAEETSESTDEVIAKIEAGEASPGLLAAIKSVCEETFLSVESVFQSQNSRGIKPLDAAVVIQGSQHPEPKFVEMNREKQQLVDAMGAAMAKALAAHTKKS